MSTALTMAESKQMSYGQYEKIFVIAPSRQSVADFARFVKQPAERFVWARGPEYLQGMTEPLVIILPNWWRHDYTDMEQALVDCEAEIYTVHYGRKPVYKNNQPILPRN